MTSNAEWFATMTGTNQLYLDWDTQKITYNISRISCDGFLNHNKTCTFLTLDSENITMPATEDYIPYFINKSTATRLLSEWSESSEYIVCALILCRLYHLPGLWSRNTERDKRRFHELCCFQPMELPSRFFNNINQAQQQSMLQLCFYRLRATFYPTAATLDLKCRHRNSSVIWQTESFSVLKGP